MNSPVKSPWLKFEVHPAGNHEVFVGANEIVSLRHMPGYTQIGLRNGQTFQVMGSIEDVLQVIQDNEKDNVLYFGPEIAGGAVMHEEPVIVPSEPPEGQSGVELPSIVRDNLHAMPVKAMLVKVRAIAGCPHCCHNVIHRGRNSNDYGCSSTLANDKGNIAALCACLRLAGRGNLADRLEGT